MIAKNTQKSKGIYVDFAFKEIRPEWDSCSREVARTTHASATSRKCDDSRE